MSQENLRSELEKISKRLGGDLFGVADLTLAYDYICNLGGSQVEFVRKFPRAISVGIRLLDSVVDELYKQDPALNLCVPKSLL
jgi:hypothetical protein